jgi:uncharacterized phage protein (TIGR01671 family)
MAVKFRVWDNLKKQMIYPGENLIDGDGYRYFIFIGQDGTAFQVYPLRESAAIVSAEPRFVVMLWSGYKDKNGKEIYDGDIVEFEKWGQKITGLVKCSNCSVFIEQITHATAHLDELTIPLYFYEYNSPTFGWNELVVIGNKFETPNLPSSREFGKENFVY